MAVDARTRAKLRQAAIQLRASKVAETRYARDLRAIMAGVHRGYLQALAPHLRALTGQRQDAFAPHGRTLDFLGVKVQDHIRQAVAPAFDRMAAQVDKHNKAAQKALIGIIPRAGVAAQIDIFREQNIQLMQNAAQAYADQVREVLDGPDTFGLRVEDLAERIGERADVSESRAELIARDQTLKLNSQLSQTRQKSVGISSYTWSGSLDSRERPMHLELEGQTFSWDAPPVTNEDGDTNHPGEDYQCRCVPVPLIDELADLGADDEG